MYNKNGKEKKPMNERRERRNYTEDFKIIFILFIFLIHFLGHQ